MHHYTLPVITSQQCLWCIIALYLWSHHNSVFDASLHFTCDQVTTVSLMHHYTLPVIKSQQCLWCIITLYLWSHHNSVFDASLHFTCDHITTVSLMHHYTLPVITTVSDSSLHFSCDHITTVSLVHHCTSPVITPQHTPQHASFHFCQWSRVLVLRYYHIFTSHHVNPLTLFWWLITLPSLIKSQQCHANDSDVKAMITRLVWTSWTPISAVPKKAVNSLGPSDAIWWCRSWSTLVQVIACCLMAQSHYLNQCWLIINKVLWHSSEDIIIRRFEGTNQ